MGGSGISWTICRSAPRPRQMTVPAPYRSIFYRPDALPATQPTASKHWRKDILAIVIFFTLVTADLLLVLMFVKQVVTIGCHSLSTTWKWWSHIIHMMNYTKIIVFLSFFIVFLLFPLVFVYCLPQSFNIVHWALQLLFNAAISSGLWFLRGRVWYDLTPPINCCLLYTSDAADE